MSQIKLSELMKVWDLLHTKDTGELGFSDFEKALEYSGVKVVNDISPYQPISDEERLKQETGTLLFRFLILAVLTLSGLILLLKSYS